MSIARPIVTYTFDGGGSHNGSPAGWGWAAYLDRQEIHHGCGGLPPGTSNNVAEYRALEMAATHALVHDWEQEIGGAPALFHFLGDSDLVVQQVRGLYTVRSSSMKSCYDRVMHVLEPLTYDIDWHPRKQNARADELATLGRQRFGMRRMHKVPRTTS